MVERACPGEGRPWGKLWHALPQGLRLVRPHLQGRTLPVITQQVTAPATHRNPASVLCTLAMGLCLAARPWGAAAWAPMPCCVSLLRHDLTLLSATPQALAPASTVQQALHSFPNSIHRASAHKQMCWHANTHTRVYTCHVHKRTTACMHVRTSTRVYTCTHRCALVRAHRDAPFNASLAWVRKRWLSCGPW